MYEPFFAFFNNVFVSFVAFYSFLSIGLLLPVIVLLFKSCTLVVRLISITSHSIIGQVLRFSILFI